MPSTLPLIATILAVSLVESGAERLFPAPHGLLAPLVTVGLLGVGALGFWLGMRGQQARAASMVVPSAEGAVTGCLTTRQALEESYGRCLALANATFEALLIHDQGLILEVNDAFINASGYAREDLIGKSIFAFLPEPPLPEVLSSLQTPLTSLEQSIGPYEVELRNRAGESLTMEIRTKALPYYGKLVRVAAFRDVTERRKLERAKQELVSIVSHELRCPLGSLHNSLEVLASRDGDLPERGRRMIDIALRSTSRLIRLTNQTLDYEQLSAGRIALILTDCSAADLLQEAADSMRGHAEATGITLTVTAEPLSLSADADRIVQVLVNLLSNALKVAPAGSTIDLQAKRSDGGIRFEVHDQGPGIPPEHQERIFERFKQLKTPSGPRGGSGLGLAICRELIALHGGQIAVESMPGAGSTFFFTLPSEKGASRAG